MSGLTLSMIVKNEEKHLAGCLESVKDIVDEIVIVDTGSSDRTIEIAKKYNAHIYHFDWINDFSAARNFALSKSGGSWILYLDADERLHESSKEELRRITSSNTKSGYYCQVKSLDSEYGRDNQMSYVRLFSNSHGISFNGKVHEQILPSLLEHDYFISESSILIEHIGYDIDTDRKKEKAKRNLELLLREYVENKSPYNEFQLALTYQVLENYSEAAKYFLLAAENKSFNVLYRAHAYTSLAVIYNKRHNITEAEKYLTKSISLRSDDAFTHLLASKIFLRKNEIKKAIEHCNQAEYFNRELKDGKTNGEYSVYLNEEEIILSGLTIARQTGDNVIFKNYYRKFIEYVNSSNSSRKEKIISALEKMNADKSLNEDELKILRDYASRQNLQLLIFLLKDYSELNSKMELLKSMLQLFPGNAELQKEIAECYILNNEHKNAAEIYQNLANDNNNEDPAIYFYLLSFYLTDGNYASLNRTIEKIEKEFSNIPEVIERINLIKTKLSSILTT